MSNLRAPWQNGPYKNQHTEQRKNTYIRHIERKNILNVFSDYSFLFSFLFIILKWFLQEMSYVFFSLLNLFYRVDMFLKEKNNINNYTHMQYALRCRFYPQSMNGQARGRSRLLKELPFSLVVWHTEDNVW